MTQTLVQVSVENIPDDELDEMTGELQAQIEACYSGVEVSRHTSGQGKQDAGTILQIILNAGAVAIIAKGIADWLRLRHGAEVKIVCKDGTTVIAKSVTVPIAENVILAALRECENRQAKQRTKAKQSTKPKAKRKTKPKTKQ